MRLSALSIAGALTAASAFLAGVPAAQADQPSGIGCSMATSDLGSLAGPGTQSGLVQGGPATALGEPFAIRCSVQVNVADALGPDAESRQSDSGPAPVLPPTPISFSASYGDAVYLCTEYLFANGDVWRPDADPGTPGDQCPAARRTEHSGGQSYSATMDEICAWYDGTSPPTGACVPVPA